MPPRKHVQVYRKEYSVEWPVLIRSRKSSQYIFCTVCNSDFIIAHGGKNDCSRHVSSTRHIRNAEAAASSKRLQEMLTTTTDDGLDVVNAESLFTKFIIEHNLPISIADHAGPLFKRMFKDSKIASKYKCARTKTTEIIKTFSKATQKNIIDNLRENKFSIATDGSNSTADEKLFPIVVTYFDETIGKVSTVLLSLAKLEKDATGENIFSLIDAEFKRNSVSWKNCVAFGADNASVMLGEHKGVGAFIRKENPSTIIHGCACHLIHLAAQRATRKIDYDIEGFLVDVYYYFKKSTKRVQLFKFCEEACEIQDRKILKYGSTRWLSMGRVIDRFLEQWLALKKFFCEEENGTSSTFFHLKEMFENPLTELYLYFLQSVMPIFLSTNTLMQREEPLIYKYRQEMRNLFTSILSRFLKPTSVVNASNIFEINFGKQSNQKEDTELVIGGKARLFIKDSSLSPDDLKKFYTSVRNFYIEACTYMSKKFSLSDDIYANSEVADISIRHKAKFSSIEYFLNLFSVAEDERNNIEEEFGLYQIDELNTDIVSSTRCDQAWSYIAKIKDMNGAVKYKYLPSLMHNILLLPHSNAACERIFSMVKKNMTEYRSSMSVSTLEALMVEKCKNNATACFETVFTKNELILAKQATYKALSGQAD